MRGRIFLGICLLLIGSGCATPGTDVVRRGQELLVACPNVITSRDQLSYSEAHFEEPVKFSFDEQSSILQEEEERRFAKGFALPAGNGAYSVSITSYKSGTTSDPAILYPDVQVLDKEFRTIRRLPYSSFVFRPSQSGEGLNTVFFVNDNAEGERFLLITNRPVPDADLMTSQANITGRTPLVIPVGSGGFLMWMVPTGSNTPPIKMKASPCGQLEVAFKKYQPKIVGQ
jgi:hypothetical protein